MNAAVKLAFERETVTLQLAKILPTRSLTPSDKSSAAYKTVEASIQVVGIVEPLVVFRQPDGTYILLEGHARLSSLLGSGVKVAECLVSLDDTGLAVSSREERERVRLLYVGFTRARDHLILAAGVNRTGPHAKWLDELVDKRGNLLLELPAAVDPSGKTVVRIGSGTRRLEVPARHWQLGTDASPPARLAGAESHVWFEAPAASSSPRPRYGISPSSASVDWPDLPPLALGAVESIGERLPLGKRVDVEADVIGNAVHAFLAADVPERTREERLALAKRLLTAAELGELLSPEALLQSSDQLRAWVVRRWPGAVWRREYPIRATVDSPVGARRVHGTIDLLLETPDGVVIVDHKSFLGEAPRWPKKAGEFASQLAAYAWVMRAAGKRVLGSYVHFAVGAGTVELVAS
jgi:ATP-dependent helicase/nuclease subunit A